MAIHKYLLVLLLCAGIFAALSLWPAMAADVVIDKSATGVGTTGGNGAGGAGGADGGPATVVDGVLIGPAGGNGEDGQPGDPGGSGATGGEAVVTTTAPTDGNIVITSNGGTGGNGGSGGKGGNGWHGSDAMNNGVRGVSARGGDGGDGGDGGIGGVGGTGGAGGIITLQVEHALTGSIDLSAQGGDGGLGGVGGVGGNGATGGFGWANTAPFSRGGDGGDGGNGSVGGALAGPGGAAMSFPEPPYSLGGESRGQAGASDPARFRGADGQTGAGGTITVAINAAVGGGINANAGTGTISIKLNDGASVRDPIVANAEAQSALRFAMSIKNRSEYKAAKAYLGDSANALGGSLTINGNIYSWSGFDELIAVLRYAGLSTYDPGMDRRSYLSCRPRAVTAFHQNGTIQLIASRTADRGAFRIGTVLGQTFASQNDAGWTVAFDTPSKFTILDASDGVIATCQG